MTRRRSTAGVVLLSVLLVLALLSALAWQLMSKHALVIAQARFSFTGDQSLQYALGAEQFARQVLVQEWRQGGADKDTLQEVWARPAAPFEIDNGLLEIQVRDLHRCFNLNSLAGNAAEQNLERLRMLLRNRNVPETLADAWRDWVDADEQVQGFGAEDGEYLLEEPAYRTANRPAAHVSEFQLIRGVEGEHLEALGDTLCVRPDTDLGINVNTASAGVMAAMSPNLSETQMQAFAESERDYDNVTQVVNEFPDLTPAVDALTVTSEYFQINIRAQMDSGRTELSSVLRRDPGSGEITLVSRDFGRDFRSLVTVETEEAQ